MSSRAVTIADQRSEDNEGDAKASQAQAEAKGKQGAIPELPVLQYGRNCNLSEFTKALSAYARRIYKDLGRIIDDLQYYEPPPVAYDTRELAEAKDPGGVKRAMVIEKVKARERRIMAMLEDRTPLFAVIWGQLSPESEEKIRLHPTYEAQIKPGNDPLALWNAIRATHMVTASGAEIMGKEYVLERYYRMRQKPSEGLTQFKQRMDDTIKAMASFGIEPPAAAHQAVHFIRGLDDYRYAHFKAELENQVACKIRDFPPSLADAYVEAGRYKVAVHKPRLSGAQTSVFVTTAEEAIQSDTEDTGVSDDEEKRPAQPKKSNRGGKKTKEQDDSGDRKKKCMLCDQPGHYVSKCPYLEQCRDMIESKANKDSKKERATITIGRDIGEVVF